MAYRELTERQKQLDCAIEGCGVKLDNSRSCLRKVMSKIGAGASEEAFVAQLIQLRLRKNALLRETDKFIDNTEAMLDSLKKSDEE